MEFSPKARFATSALAGVGLMSTPLIAVASPAFAADCGTTTPAATEVAAGICEVVFDSPGDYSFTAPSGIAKLTALVVGGGGGATYYNGTYGGGGGAVVYVADVSTAAPVDITVGAGVDSSSPQAESSSVGADVAEGGFSGTYVDLTNQYFGGGSSGNGNAGSAFGFSDAGAGGGAGGPAAVEMGGIGVTASDAAGDAVLWPAVAGEPAYGKGGDYLAPIAISDVAGEGAPSDGSFGNDGIVILRWAPIEPALVNTGLSMTNIWLGAMFAAGLMLVAFGSLSAKGQLRFAGRRDRLIGLLRETDAKLRRQEDADGLAR